MRILVARLKLNNFLTFSSSIGFSVIGRVSYPVYKPQPYIHNYALMYGFAGILYASLASPTNPRHPNEIDYRFLDESEKKRYVYPARPRNLVIKRMLCNIKGEGYAELTQPKPKTLYPWHVIHMYFAPQSIFETVIILQNEEVRLPRVIRIGAKRQGVFKVDYVPAKIKGYTRGISDPINLGDIKRLNLEPDSYIVVLTTKTKRKGVPYSNYIVKGFYEAEKLAIIEARAGNEIISFRLPIPFS